MAMLLSKHDGAIGFSFLLLLLLLLLGWGFNLGN
jgi:hypothetical protein